MVGVLIFTGVLDFGGVRQLMAAQDGIQIWQTLGQQHQLAVKSSLVDVAELAENIYDLTKAKDWAKVGEKTKASP